MMEIGYFDVLLVCVGIFFVDLCGGVYLFSGIVSVFYGCEKS